MKIRLFIILLLFSFFYTEAKDRVTSNNAFKPGEMMKLKAYYHFGMLWFEVGEATFAAILMYKKLHKEEIRHINR